MNQDLGNVSNWLARNKLSLNVEKTHFMVIGTPQRLSKISSDDIYININDFHLQRVDYCKHLGVIVDEK